MYIPFPKFATTGIGSLPGTELSAALMEIFSLDIPYLPTFPQAVPSEDMLRLALDGFPGASLEEGGSWTFSEAEWERRVQAGNFGEWMRPVALEKFLDQCAGGKIPWLKAQGMGPVTLATVFANWNFSSDEMAERVWEMALRYLRYQAHGICQLLRTTGAEILYFFDEPTFSENTRTDPWGSRGHQALVDLTQDIQSLGVRVGVHCCGSGSLGDLLKSSVDVLSFDANLSLAPLLTRAEELESWWNGGGRLALGLVPTRLPEGWDPEGVVEKIRAEMADSLGSKAQELWESCLLTPACGLGLRELGEAQAVWQALGEIKHFS